MTLTSSARLGPYEILTPIGAGGMGEGQRFPVNTNAEEAARVPITVVVHWTAELKK
jgi:hypothetical protein